MFESVVLHCHLSMYGQCVSSAPSKLLQSIHRQKTTRVISIVQLVVNGAQVATGTSYDAIEPVGVMRSVDQQNLDFQRVMLASSHWVLRSLMRSLRRDCLDPTLSEAGQGSPLGGMRRGPFGCRWQQAANKWNGRGNGDGCQEAGELRGRTAKAIYDKSKCLVAGLGLSDKRMGFGAIGQKQSLEVPYIVFYFLC